MTERIEELIKLAESGDVEAQFNLGKSFDDGKDVDIDKSKAIYWYTKAAELGFSKAQFNLAYMFDVGDGIEIDKNQAVYWYTKAAEQGHTVAQFNLALMYDIGDGINVDKVKALYWYTKAAEQGYPEAQFNLGFMYDNGDGVDIDKSKAIYWYTKAAEQGIKEAQHNLGFMYNSGDGVDIDKSKAIYWYTKAAEQGYGASQINLGLIYSAGNGIEVDKSKAIYWFRKAAEQGIKEAQYSLGEMIYRGDGTPVNEREALELFKKAADNGFSESLYAMALVLLESNEYLKAKEYLELFVKQQSEDTGALSDAYFRLSQFYIEYDKEKGKTKNLRKAKEYLDLAVELGSEDAEELLKAINDELYIGDSQNNRMGLLAKELIEKNVPISNLSEEAEKTIKGRFGKMYDYLKPATKASLVTSLLTYVSFMSVGEAKYRNLDFSSVINPITKSLEIELKHVFYTCFMDYLIRNNIPPTEFDPTKQYFVSEIKPKIPPYENVDESEINTEIANTEKYNYFKQQKYDHSSAVKYVVGENNGAFSLGGMRKFIAIQEKPSVVSNVSYIDRNGNAKIVTKKEITVDKHFFNYIRDVFKEDAFSKNNRDQEIKKYLLKLVNKVGFIAFDLRNPSNHTQIMECWRATHCGNIVFMKDNFLMDFLSKIKPEYL